ncbi:hypothetical protein C7974DRAFT_387368 [Boeremia exigua]|uniref:uncharacterized protein n=1 Tax=Boeremia exigua TaxID=749465 RepID=UPI001E8E8F9B|nr:uncharacterized protein C7974DRAFT_387368 [Boeremia exigua]KAH6638815.1 hypothetical protein C7974DRAFT_387368 [Boeremia exigua]
MMIDAITAFCDWAQGRVLDASLPNTVRTLDNGDGFGAHCIADGWCFDVILISVTVLNSCRFTVGSSRFDDGGCGKILRRAVDQCDGKSTEFKQGGRVVGNCAEWRIDPNVL